jgi:hypothetical protein
MNGKKRQGCQRLDCSSRRGKKTPTLVSKAVRQNTRGKHRSEQRRCCVRDNPPKRSERREPFGPPIILRRALDSAGSPHGESRERKSGTHEMRVHASRMGGRRRLDASRVFRTGRSQGLVEREGASREEARKLCLTRGAGGQKAKRYADSRFLSGHVISACGFRLADSLHDGRHSRISSHQAFTGRVVRGPWASRSSFVRVTRGQPRASRRVAHRAVRRPTRACLRADRRVSEIDMVR